MNDMIVAVACIYVFLCGVVVFWEKTEDLHDTMPFDIVILPGALVAIIIAASFVQLKNKVVQRG